MDMGLSVIMVVIVAAVVILVLGIILIGLAGKGPSIIEKIHKDKCKNIGGECRSSCGGKVIGRAGMCKSEQRWPQGVVMVDNWVCCL